MKTKSRFEEGNVIIAYTVNDVKNKVLYVNKIGAFNTFTGHIYEFIDYNDLHKEYYDDIELRRYLRIECVYNSINDFLENEYEE